jgi:SAM-dependent methyltransferase
VTDHGDTTAYQEDHERRRRSFEHTAELYERYRPTYPPEIFDAVRSYADLAPDDPILEVGAGTGRATVHLAMWGNPMVVIEPAPAMAEIARRNVTGQPQVDVRTTTFEDAGIEQNAFGLVLVARAFAWLDPVTRIERIHDALYAHGTASIVDNFQVNPDSTRPFFERVQDVYQEFAPDVMHKGDFASPDDRPHHPLRDSASFTDFEQAEHRWEWTLSAGEYIGLMSTHSNHATLERDVRARLHQGIADLINAEFDGHVTEHYVAVAALARKR